MFFHFIGTDQWTMHCAAVCLRRGFFQHSELIDIRYSNQSICLHADNEQNVPAVWSFE